MKKAKRILIILIAIILAIGAFIYSRLQPAFEMGKLHSYNGSRIIEWSTPNYDSSKKTVVIIADNEGTEMFDALAPFYLFNATGKANVYFVADKKAPVVMAKGLFILPSFSFSEIDSLKIKPDVIVIPKQSVDITRPQKPVTVNWIKNHYDGKNIILSICSGSATAAATGLYDQKPITTHATDFEKLKKMYPKATWIKNVSVTQAGNLFSTAGVSNAAEGSLTVINYLFGRETMQKLLTDIRYPAEEIKTTHNSIAFGTGSYLTAFKKLIFRKNNRIGVLLENGINEFDLAALLDTYHRTIPASIETLTVAGASIKSKFGLTMYSTTGPGSETFDEIHVLMSKRPTEMMKQFGEAKLISYDQSPAGYPFDIYLDRVEEQYGVKFKQIVKLALDYN